MNNKDKQSFEEITSTMSFPDEASFLCYTKGWEDACHHKQKENQILKEEIKKLKEDKNVTHQGTLMEKTTTPDFWGNFIYESAMGLYYTENEAREDAWMGEHYFPLYTKEQIEAITQAQQAAIKNLNDDKEKLIEFVNLVLKWDDPLAMIALHDHAKKMLQELNKK